MKASFVLATLCVFFLACACGRASNNEQQPTATSEALADSPFHETMPRDEYLDLLSFDIAGLLNQFNPDYQAPPVTEKAYLSALRKLDANEPNKLTSRESETLLSVSWFALMEQLKTIRYSLTERTASGAESLSSQEVSFAAEKSANLPGVTIPQAVAFRGVEQTPGPALNSLGTPVPDEEIDLFGTNGLEKGSMQLTQWRREGSTWICRRGDPGMAQSLVFPLFMPDTGFLHSTISSEEKIDGRTAYKLNPPDDAESILGSPVSYWIDKETFLPLQFEYRLENGNIQRYAIEEVNGNVSIEPPAVNITCEEKDFEP